MTLVLGASGATGRHLVEQLVMSEQAVTVLVRTPEALPQSWHEHNLITIRQGSISEMTDRELGDCLEGCDAVASCLGHNMSLKGIYGKPRRLVTDAIARTCSAIIRHQPIHPVKIVLMNTAGNRNRDLNEPISPGERLVIALLRLLLPPHPDNEKAADFLRLNIGQSHQMIEWSVVRPDNLIDKDKVSAYQLYASPTRSALFNPGQTSRINVANFMARLISDNDLWRVWKGQMPVIYNDEAKTN